MSGPRGRPSGHSHRVRSRARARRQRRAEALQSATTGEVPASPQLLTLQRPAEGQLARRSSGRRSVSSRRASSDYLSSYCSSDSEYAPSDGWESDVDTAPIMAPVTTIATTGGSVGDCGASSSGLSNSGTFGALAMRRTRRVSVTPGRLGSAHINSFDSDLEEEEKPQQVVQEEGEGRHQGAPLAGLMRVGSVRGVSVAAGGGHKTVARTVSASSQDLQSPSLPLSPLLPSSSSSQSPRNDQEFVPFVMGMGGSGVVSSSAPSSTTIAELDSLLSESPPPMPRVPQELHAPLPALAIPRPPATMLHKVGFAPVPKRARVVPSPSPEFTLPVKSGKGKGLLLSQFSSSSAASFTSSSSSSASFGALGAGDSVASGGTPPSLVPSDEFESGVLRGQVAFIDWGSGDSMEEKKPQLLEEEQGVCGVPVTCEKTKTELSVVNTAPDRYGWTGETEHEGAVAAVVLQEALPESKSASCVVPHPPVSAGASQVMTPVPDEALLQNNHRVSGGGAQMTGTVLAGTDLWEEFVDLECATMASEATPLTREASLMRALEAVGAEMMMTPPSCEASLFAGMW